VYAPPIAGVEPGIDRVTTLINNNRLDVFDDLERVLWEFSTYSRDMDDSGHVFEQIKNKHDYHCLDALRYVVVSVYNGEDIELGENIWT
jgi:hypothetical protein